MLFPYQDERKTRRFPLVTVLIIVVNMAVFAFEAPLIYNPAKEIQYTAFVDTYGFVPARLAQLFQANPQPIRIDLYPELQIQEKQLGVPFGSIRISEDRPRFVILSTSRLSILSAMVTCMFLHGSLWHLAGNMWFFWLFGNNIEDRLGAPLFLIYYLLGGMCATLSHVWLGDGGLIPIIGASGAVAVIMGAYAAMYPYSRVRCFVFLLVIFFFIELPALLVLGLWFAFQIVEAMSPQPGVSAGVAWWAHIGGFVLGMFTMPMLAALRPDLAHEDEKRGPPRGPQGPGGPFGPQPFQPRQQLPQQPRGIIEQPPRQEPPRRDGIWWE